MTNLPWDRPDADPAGDVRRAAADAYAEGQRFLHLGPGQLWSGPAGAPPRRRPPCHVCMASTDTPLAYRDEDGNHFCSRQHWEQGRPAPVVVTTDGTQDVVCLGGPSAGQRLTVSPYLNEFVVALPGQPAWAGIGDETYPTTAAAFPTATYHRAWPAQHVDGRAVFTTTGRPHPAQIGDRIDQLVSNPPPTPPASYVDVMEAIVRALAGAEAWGDDSWEYGPYAATWRAGDADADSAPRQPGVLSIDIIANATAVQVAFERVWSTDWVRPQAPYRDGYRVHVEAVARLFDVPLHVLTGDPVARRRRHDVRVAYRRRQLARRRRR